MNQDWLHISQGYLTEVAKRYQNSQDAIDQATGAIPPTVEAGEVSEAIEAIATRLIEAATALSGLCGTASESITEIVKTAELDEENIAEVFRKLEI